MRGGTGAGCRGATAGWALSPRVTGPGEVLAGWRGESRSCCEARRERLVHAEGRRKLVVGLLGP